MKEQRREIDLAALSNRASIENDVTEGRRRLKLGDFQQASFHFQRALSLDPQSAVAHRGLGSVYSRLGDLESAEKHVARALELEPDDVSSLNERGDICLARREFRKAEEMFNRALAADPNSSRAHINLLKLYGVVSTGTAPDRRQTESILRHVHWISEYAPDQNRLPLMKENQLLRETLLEKTKNLYNDSSTGILLHRPANGALKYLMESWAEVLNFMGIRTDLLNWNQDTREKFETFHPSVFITVANPDYIDQIDENYLRQFRKDTDLKVGHISGLQHRFEPCDFIVTFHLDPSRDKRFKNLDLPLISLPFGINPLRHYMRPGRDVWEYFFVGTNSHLKTGPTNDHLLPILENYRGILAGVNWSTGVGELPLHEAALMYNFAHVYPNYHLRQNFEAFNEVNERTYIIPACGGFELVDNPVAMEEMFYPDEMAIAHSPSEYQEMFEHFLHYPEDRLPYIRAGMQRVYGEYTLFHILSRLSEFLGIKSKGGQSTQDSDDEVVRIESCSSSASEMLKKGEALVALGKLDEAEQFFQKVVAARPASWAAYNSLGVVAFEKHQNQLAADYFLKSVSINPTGPDALANLCELMRSSDNLHEIAPLLESLHIKYPDNEQVSGFLREARSISDRCRPHDQATVEIKSGLPKISVLVPTYNRSSLLRQALNSILRQKYPNLEIVVVDDCSTDDTRDVVETMRREHSEIVYYRNEENMGGITNFGIAGRHATGDYILMTSDDDTTPPGALHKIVQPLERHRCDLIYCDLQIIDENNRPTDVWTYRDYDNKWDLLKHLMQAGGNVIPDGLLFRRDVFEETYIEYYQRRMITPVWLAAMDRLNLVHVNQPLKNYRIHGGCTFANLAGLMTRNKSVMNHLNAVMFRHDLLRIFESSTKLTREQAIGEALLKYVAQLLEHGNVFVDGEFYTGYRFTPQDRLYVIYFEFAWYWLRQARKYLPPSDVVNTMATRILEQVGTDYDPVEICQMPDVYRRLPWFAYRTPHILCEFVPFDMITLGQSTSLGEAYYSLFKEGKTDVKIHNDVITTLDELSDLISRRIIHVVNVFDESLLDGAIRILEDNALYFTTVMNFTERPAKGKTLLKNIYPIYGGKLNGFGEYLAELQKVSGSLRWPRMGEATGE